MNLLLTGISFLAIGLMSIETVSNLHGNYRTHQKGFYIIDNVSLPYEYWNNKLRDSKISESGSDFILGLNNQFVSRLSNEEIDNIQSDYLKNRINLFRLDVSSGYLY